MMEYRDLGHIEEIPRILTEDTRDDMYYIPYLSVM